MNIELSRNYWPWLLIAIPFAAVIFGIVMVLMIVRYPDDLVVDDYYKDGMSINLRLKMDNYAVENLLSAKIYPVTREAEGGYKFRIETEHIVDAAIEMNLFHVTTKDLDQNHLLVPIGDNLYELEAPSLSVLDEVGTWYIELRGADGRWRLRSRLKTPLQTTLVLGNE